MSTVASGVVAAGVFLLGIAAVVWSVEVFIEAVARSAVSLGLSGFFLAVLLAGVDLENAMLGVVAAGAALPDLALGTVFGEAVFVLAVAVGLAGVAVPFRTTVPTHYLALTMLAPVPAFVLSLDGVVSRPGGTLLFALFVPLLFVVYRLEANADTRYMVPEDVDHLLDSDPEGSAGNPDPGAAEATEPSDEDRDADETVVEEALERLVPDLAGRSGTVQFAVAVAAAVGMTVGSAVAVTGAEGVLAAFDLSGLAFGATVMSFIASLEELFLTVEPVRRNRPEIAVGNVVGSTVFYVTANVGLIALLHPVATGGAVLTVHWPVFAACLLVVVGSLARGRVTRAGGAVLLALYATYWVANYA
jgi:cation:H+ antiporter